MFAVYKEVWASRSKHQSKKAANDTPKPFPWFAQKNIPTFRTFIYTAKKCSVFNYLHVKLKKKKKCWFYFLCPFLEMDRVRVEAASDGDLIRETTLGLSFSLGLE